MLEIFKKQNECFKEARDLGKALDTLADYTNFETHIKLCDKEEKLWKKYEFFKELYEAMKRVTEVI